MLEQILLWLGFTLVLTLPCIIIYILIAIIARKLNKNKGIGKDKNDAPR